MKVNAVPESVANLTLRKPHSQVTLRFDQSEIRILGCSYHFCGGLLHDSSINELIEVGRETLVDEVGVLS